MRRYPALLVETKRALKPKTRMQLELSKDKDTKKGKQVDLPKTLFDLWEQEWLSDLTPQRVFISRKSPGQAYLITNEEYCAIVDVRSEMVLAQIRLEVPGPYSACALSREESLLALVPDWDTAAWVVSLQDGSLLYMSERVLVGPLESVAVSEASQKVIMGCPSSAVAYIGDISSGKKHCEWDLPGLSCLCVHPVHDTFLAGDHCGEVSCWHMSPEIKCVWRHSEDDKGAVLCIDLSSDGALLAVGYGESADVMIWNVASGEEEIRASKRIVTPDCVKDGIMCVRFVLDDTHIATIVYEGFLAISCIDRNERKWWFDLDVSSDFFPEYELSCACDLIAISFRLEDEVRPPLLFSACSLLLHPGQTHEDYRKLLSDQLVDERSELSDDLSNLITTYLCSIR